MAGRERPKVWNPEPKAINGARSAKEVENFVFDVTQYFRVAHIPEADKVSITSMYLVGDVKLWWRTRIEDSSRQPITDWPEMKQELRNLFLPCNVHYKRLLKAFEANGFS